MEKEFKDIVCQIIKNSNFIKMDESIHHGNVSTYKHSLLVAYLSYLFVKKQNLKNIDIYSLIRGAMLHDYYLYDWHKKKEGHRFHGFRHPYFALKNALKVFPDLNKKERNIILRHMWPLTIIPPRYKEAWIVQYCDKKATFHDYFSKKKKIKK